MLNILTGNSNCRMCTNTVLLIRFVTNYRNISVLESHRWQGKADSNKLNKCCVFPRPIK